MVWLHGGGGGGTGAGSCVVKPDSSGEGKERKPLSPSGYAAMQHSGPSRLSSLHTAKRLEPRGENG